MSHANAALTPRQRLRVARLQRTLGESGSKPVAVLRTKQSSLPAEVIGETLLKVVNDPLLCTYDLHASIRDVIGKRRRQATQHQHPRP